jgi:hypothetical protein
MPCQQVRRLVGLPTHLAAQVGAAASVKSKFVRTHRRSLRRDDRSTAFPFRQSNSQAASAFRIDKVASTAIARWVSRCAGAVFRLGADSVIKLAEDRVSPAIALDLLPNGNETCVQRH